MRKQTLYDDTMRLLETRNVSLETVARGASNPPWDPELIITIGFLRKVMDGTTTDPGVKRIQAVHDYLMQ